MTGKAGAPLTEAMFYVLMALRRGEVCGTEIAAWTERCTEGRCWNLHISSFSKRL